MCHLEITIEAVLRGDFGVSFLSREYSPDVWFGDRNSMCSLHRQLSKLHLTVHLPTEVTPADKLAEKLLAYSYTDSKSPIFNQLIPAFKRIMGDGAGNTNHLKIWNKISDLSAQYVNVEASWMYDAAEKQMPGFNYVLLRTWLQTATTADHLLNGPVLFEPGYLPVVNKTYLLNGQMVTPSVLATDVNHGIGANIFAPSVQPDRMNSSLPVPGMSRSIPIPGIIRQPRVRAQRGQGQQQNRNRQRPPRGGTAPRTDKVDGGTKPRWSRSK